MSKVWLAVGSPQNWRTALEHGNTWGLKASQTSLWEAVAEGDVVLFYATAPVSGVVGYGTVRTKFKQNQPLWPLEVRENRVIWPLLFEFAINSILPPEYWESKRTATGRIRALVRSGFQLLDPPAAEEALRTLQASSLGPLPPIVVPQGRGAEAVAVYPPSHSIPPDLSPHDSTKFRLMEIGRMQYMIAESEYAVEGTRLDVVWRRAERSVPLHAFEVQVGGDIYHALTKLKQAFHLWNSRVYLVADPDDQRKYETLLSTAFHELSDRARFITIPKIEELHRAKLQFKELEKEMGIA